MTFPKCILIYSSLPVSIYELIKKEVVCFVDILIQAAIFI